MAQDTGDAPQQWGRVVTAVTALRPVDQRDDGPGALLSPESASHAMDYTTNMLIAVIVSNLKHGVWDADPAERDRMVRMVADLKAEVGSRQKARLRAVSNE